MKSTKLEGLRETFDIEPIAKESAPRYVLLPFLVMGSVMGQFPLRNGVLLMILITVKSSKLEGLLETFDIEPIAKESAPQYVLLLFR